MAGETTTTTADDIRFAAWVTSEILLEIRPMMVIRPFYRVAPAAKSLLYDFPKQDVLAISNVVDPLAEATDLTVNVPMTTSKATVTAAQQGIRATVTDLLIKVSIIDAMPHFQGVLSRTMAQKQESDLCSLLGTFTQITDAAGVQTITNFLAAIAALEQRDITSTLVGVFHPKSVGEIRTSLTTQTGAYWGRDNGTADNADLEQYHRAGYVTTLFNVPIHQTSLVPTTDAAAKRGNAIFASGEALGLYELWGVRAELQRDASLLATEVILSVCKGVVKIDDTRGQTVKSTA